MLAPQKSHADLELERHLKFDLKAEVAHLGKGELQAGRNSRTLMKAPDLRVVLVTAKKGTFIKEHRADGSVTILAVAGSIRLKLASGNVDLNPGELLGMDRGLSHDVEALSDSAFLVTIGWPKNN